MKNKTQNIGVKGINRSSLLFIFGSILSLIAVTGAGLLAYILPLSIENNLSKSFETQLLPNLEEGMENLGGELEYLLEEKKQESLTQADESFVGEKAALAKSMAALMLPIL